MESELGLTEQDNKAASEKIVAEANAANVVFVPTVIVGEHILMSTLVLKNYVRC